jgi:hypothetical protein
MAVSDTEQKRLVADIGGMPAGPIDTVDHGMTFWERQANAMRSTLSRKGITRTDELRRTAEELGARYAGLAYFERTTEALRACLIEKGLVTDEELVAKMAEVRARYEAAHAARSTGTQRSGR